MKRTVQKKITSTLAGVLLLGTVFSVAYASNQNNNVAINKTAGNLDFIGDEYYRMLQVDTDNPILLNRLQDRDYAKIKEFLVDESSEPLTLQALKEIEVDPNARVVDNMLQDGRFLKENWDELQHKMIEEALTVRTLNGIRTKEQINPQEFETSVKTSHGDIAIKLQKVQVDGKTIVIPKNSDDIPVQFSITPDGQKSLVSAENGLWLVNSSNNQLELLLPSTYNGKTFEALAEESMNLYGENIVVWNEDVMSSPDSKTLVYNSNKNNIKTRGSALFVYDITTGNETIIADAEGANYLVDGWLTPESVLCKKITSSGMKQVVVSLDGKEAELDLVGEAPYIYAVQDGLIAYATALSSGEIHIAKIDKSGTLQEITSTKLNGTTRLRASNKGFSSDNSYFAFIYVPDDVPEARYIKVIDLNSDKLIDLDFLPAESNSSARYLEFSWTDENTLLLVVKEEINETKKMSTWTYSLR
ncbi:hypothetical protein AB4Z50_34855 [Paenibacillus sp. 2TAB26]|uniref:hypothetical protein n=1 Tax=Paenibacillus sp. 2TAB26 TaxID=3233005 RepID=UPI003F966948